MVVRSARAGAGAAAPPAQRPCVRSPQHCGSSSAAARSAAPRKRRIVHRRPATGANGDAPPTPTPPTTTPAPAPPPPARAAQTNLPAVGDAVGVVQWGGTLPSRRRFFLGTSAGAVVALGGNLLGVTSALLSSSPGTAAAARRARLDVVFPVEGQLRFFDEALRFEFSYPRQWMGDVTLARRRAELQEREREGLQGLPSLRRPPASSAPPAVEPAAAFGPPGSTGEENVSVVVAPIAPGFSLEQLGAPHDAARRFLDQTVAPPGSGRTAELFAASAGRRPSGGAGDPAVLYYTFEFGVRSPTFQRRNVSVLAARGDRLFTLNTQAPEALWGRDGALLRRTADSFVLF